MPQGHTPRKCVSCPKDATQFRLYGPAEDPHPNRAVAVCGALSCNLRNDQAARSCNKRYHGTVSLQAGIYPIRRDTSTGPKPHYLALTGADGDGLKVLVWDGHTELDKIQSRIDAGETFTSVTVTITAHPSSTLKVTLLSPVTSCQLLPLEPTTPHHDQ